MKNFKKVLSLALALLMVVGCVVVAPVDAKAEATYTKVTDVNTITSARTGDDAKYFVIVVNTGDAYYALDTITNNKVAGVTVNVADNTLSGTNIPVWTVEGASSGITLSTEASGSKEYLGYSSSTNFATKTDATDTGAQWTVTEATDTEVEDTFTFANVATPARGISYRTGSTNKWAPYALSNRGSNAEYNFDFMVFEASEAPGAATPTLPSTATQAEIVDKVYELAASSTAWVGEYTLTGVITNVDTAFDSRYNNVSVTMLVGDKTDKPIQCYRLAGNGADEIGVGDIITVTGKFETGTTRFAQGCTLDAWEEGEIEPTLPSTATSKEIIDKVYELAETGAPMIGEYTVTGVIQSIDTAYSEQYGNISITILVDGSDKTLYCYRLKGTGADVLAEEYTVTVNGSFTYYQGNPQLAEASTLVSYVAPDKAETNNNNWTAGSTEDLTIRFDMNFADFKELKINGTVVDPKNYTAVEGSVIVTLKADYLNTLEAGSYTVSAVANDDTTVDANFTVAASNIDNAGDNFLPMFLIVAAGCVIVAVGVIGKKKFA